MKLESIKKGIYIEAKDNGRWYLAKVIDYKEEESKILIHFKGWSSKFDEWKTLIDNDNIRPASIDQQNLKEFEEGDLVLARWSQKFENTPAKIISINPESKNGYTEVAFADKTRKLIRSKTIRHLDSKYDLKGYLDSLNLNLPSLTNTEDALLPELPFTDIEMIVQLKQLAEKWQSAPSPLNSGFKKEFIDSASEHITSNHEDFDEEEIPLAQYQSLLASKNSEENIAKIPLPLESNNVNPKLKSRPKYGLQKRFPSSPFKNLMRSNVKKVIRKRINITDSLSATSNAGKISNDLVRKTLSRHNIRNENRCVDNIATGTFNVSQIDPLDARLKYTYPSRDFYSFNYLLGQPFQDECIPQKYRISCARVKLKQDKTKLLPSTGKRNVVPSVSNRKIKKFECNQPGCCKIFRNSYLLESHLKHFHGLDIDLRQGIDSSFNDEDQIEENERISYLSSSTSSYDGDRDIDPEVKLLRRMRERKKLHKYARIDHHFFEGRKRNAQFLIGSTALGKQRESASQDSADDTKNPNASLVAAPNNNNNGLHGITAFSRMKKAKITFNNRAFFLNKKRGASFTATSTTVAQLNGATTKRQDNAALLITTMFMLPGDLLYLKNAEEDVFQSVLSKTHQHHHHHHYPSPHQSWRGLKRQTEELTFPAPDIISTTGLTPPHHVPPPIKEIFIKPLPTPPSKKRAKILMPFDPNALFSLKKSSSNNVLPSGSSPLSSSPFPTPLRRDRNINKSNHRIVATPKLPASIFFSDKKLPSLCNVNDNPLPAATITTEQVEPHLKNVEEDTIHEVVEEEVDFSQLEIVHCTCGSNQENGLMMQCELCSCWQHSTCLGYNDDPSKVPEHYVCWFCIHPQNVVQTRLDEFLNVDWVKDKHMKLAKIKSKNKRLGDGGNVAFQATAAEVEPELAQTNYDKIFSDAINIERNALAIGCGIRNLRIKLLNLPPPKLHPQQTGIDVKGTSPPATTTTTTLNLSPLTIPTPPHIDLNGLSNNQGNNGNLQKIIEDLLLSPNSLNGGVMGEDTVSGFNNNNQTSPPNLSTIPSTSPTTPPFAMTRQNSLNGGGFINMVDLNNNSEENASSTTTNELNFNLLLLQEAAAALSNHTQTTPPHSDVTNIAQQQLKDDGSGICQLNRNDGGDEFKLESEDASLNHNERGENYGISKNRAIDHDTILRPNSEREFSVNKENDIIDEWESLTLDEIRFEKELDRIEAKLTELENNPYFLFDSTKLTLPVTPYHNHAFSYDERKHYSNPLANYDPFYPDSSKIKSESTLKSPVTALHSIDLYGTQKALNKIYNQIKSLTATSQPLQTNHN